MKYLVLAAEALAGEPLEALQGRTALEVAKTPVLDELAKKSKVGTTSFVPSALAPTAEVACMSMLGFDPLEFYTGIAPLEAITAGIQQADQDVVFRADFVTLAEDTLVDPYAGHISQKESGILLQALNEAIQAPHMRFQKGEGYKNFLLINDPECVDELDELECHSPLALRDKKISKHLPKGKCGELCADLVKRCKEVLETHEINRVRIDLGENPANAIWFWGQGKKPKVPSFKQRYGKEGSFYSEDRAVQGLGQLLGLKQVTKEMDVLGADFGFVYQALPETVPGPVDLKAHIKHIEDFDALVGQHLDRLRSGQGFRLFVTTDLVGPPQALSRTGAGTPFLIAGDGISAESALEGFTEKQAASTRWMVDRGDKLIKSLFS